MRTFFFSKLKMLWLLVLTGAGAYAQVPDALLGKVKQLAYEDSARLVTTFIDLHTHPELGFMENRTSGIVAKELKSLGYEVSTGVGKTGVVGVLKNGEGPIVMFRGDMDALPVKETTGLTYASTATVKLPDGNEVPVMHACGHDAHTTWLMGVAKIMKTLQKEWKGTLILVAQPAEEPITGARAMREDETFKKLPLPDYLIAMHTGPFPTGTVMNLPGTRMAGTDQLDVTFRGIGGHGSSPQTAKDPIVMAAEAILQYQTIISRSNDPQVPAVLTVGSVQAGQDNNVIPASALVKVNFRWLKPETRKMLYDGVARVDSGIAIGNGLPMGLFPLLVKKGYSFPVNNDTALVAKVNTTLQKVVKKGSLITAGMPTAMGSEDFHHLVLDNKKSVYDFIFVGTAPMDMVIAARKAGKQTPFSNHNGNYMVDLAGIPWGVQLGADTLLGLFIKEKQ
ncbi:MAG: amidohydrolase [Siphonobacter sp.]